MNKLSFNLFNGAFCAILVSFFLLCNVGCKNKVVTEGNKNTATTTYTQPGDSTAMEKEDPTGGANISAVLAKMQGKWQYGAVADRFLEVKGDKFITTDATGKVIGEEKFEFHRKCPETCMKNGVSGNTFCFTLSNSGGTTNCYLVRGLDGENMQYAAIDNADNVSSFVKMK